MTLRILLALHLIVPLALIASAPVAEATGLSAGSTTTSEAPVSGTSDRSAEVGPSLVDVRNFAHVTGDAAAGATKSAVCAACHGADGNAVAPIFPSLAGQPIDYLYLQLQSFKKAWRANAVMQPLVAQLNDGDLRDLAAHFASLQRRSAAPPANSEEAARGKTLYSQGDPALGIPPCQGCHGSNGAGLSSLVNTPDLANATTYPALAGLSSDYVVAQLNAFRDGTRSATTNSRIMRGVARTLDPQSQAAVAAYVAGLASQ